MEMILGDTVHTLNVGDTIYIENNTFHSLKNYLQIKYDGLSQHKYFKAIK